MSSRITVREGNVEFASKVVEPKPIEEAGETVVTVKTMTVAELQENWSAWQRAERIIKELFESNVTAAEWLVLDGIATTTPARNGLSELRSALGSWPGKKT